MSEQTVTPHATCIGNATQQNRSAKSLRIERDIDVLARTIYGEARGEPVRGKEAVAAVIMNRVRLAKRRSGYWWGDDIQTVCQKPWQFSCWNDNDPNRKKLLVVTRDNAVFKTCLRVARRAVRGTLKDPTRGATHYHTLNVDPPWSSGRTPVVIIGRHQFYNDIE